MSTIHRLAKLFEVVLQEARDRPSFARRLEQAWDERQQIAGSRDSRDRPNSTRNRRPPAALDPLALFLEGEDQLRVALAELNVEQLKDIVAEHGMDASKLAMKWKGRERLEDLIVTTVRERLGKGSAFRRDSEFAP